MRILAVETSSPRGSVSLVEGEREIRTLSHARHNAHAESILPLIERVLADSGWARSSLDRLAVGVGPGSFTGLRVGIAMARGISEGLDRPLVGVGSLRAMALGASAASPGLRCPLLDARRGEVFAAAYATTGRVAVEPFAARPAAALARLEALGDSLLLLGAGVELLESGHGHRICRGEATDLPSARFTAQAALGEAVGGRVVPTYVRDDVAVRPRLPDSPLARE